MISDRDGYFNFIDHSIHHLEADHYIPNDVWADSLLNEDAANKLNYESELFLDLNEKEFAFVKSISPSITREGYWELLFDYPEIYNKAVRVVYKIFNSLEVIDDLLESFISCDGKFENLFMGCKYDLSVTYLDKFEEKGETFDFKIEFFTVDDSCSFWATWENHKKSKSDD